MGASYALTGQDVIILNDIPLTCFADGDIGTLEVGKKADMIFIKTDKLF